VRCLEIKDFLGRYYTSTCPIPQSTNIIMAEGYSKEQLEEVMLEISDELDDFEVFW
jgi:hypothetical protein